MDQFARASATFVGPTSGATQVIDREKIRERAHQLWEAAGKPEGQEERFWHEAERQLREEQIKHETKTPDNL
jgi:Protein of unknown function (DUF2934)